LIPPKTEKVKEFAPTNTMVKTFLRMPLQRKSMEERLQLLPNTHRSIPPMLLLSQILTTQSTITIEKDTLKRIIKIENVTIREEDILMETTITRKDLVEERDITEEEPNLLISEPSLTMEFRTTITAQETRPKPPMAKDTTNSMRMITESRHLGKRRSVEELLQSSSNHRSITRRMDIG
jgi:hypothetical protein